MNYRQAKEIVQLCKRAGITLAVNQNMRYDQSIRACKSLLDQGLLGEPVLATIDMRAIPHWMPWQQRQGWVTLRIMSIHHLDTFRYLFGDPVRVFASVRPDPRTGRKVRPRGRHLPLHPRIRQRPAVPRRGTTSGPARPWKAPRRTSPSAGASKGWKASPAARSAGPTIRSPTPSTLDFTTTKQPGYWFSPALEGSLVPRRLRRHDGPAPRAPWKTAPSRKSAAQDNLKTMALVDACYLSAKEHRAVEMREMMGRKK